MNPQTPHTFCTWNAYLHS